MHRLRLRQFHVINHRSDSIIVRDIQIDDLRSLTAFPIDVADSRIFSIRASTHCIAISRISKFLGHALSLLRALCINHNDIYLISTNYHLIPKSKSNATSREVAHFPLARACPLLFFVSVSNIL